VGPEVKAELNIPDFWYDFYARFLPGTAFVLMLRIQFANGFSFPSAGEFLVIAFGGYVIALFTQPLSSRIVKFFERNVGKVKTKGQDRIKFIRTLQNDLGQSSRQSLVLGKMHAEATFFAQVSILTLVFFIVRLTIGKHSLENTMIFLLVIVLSILWSIEFVSRRFSKAKELRESLNK